MSSHANVIEEREGRGRCYIADRDYCVGDVIIDETPYAFVVCDSMFSRGGCAYCGSIDPSSAPFATCEEDWARYCCQSCMELDKQQGHMFQMRACQELFSKGIAGSLDSMRLVLKIGGKFMAEEEVMKKKGKLDKEPEKMLSAKQRKKQRDKKKKQERRAALSESENVSEVSPSAQAEVTEGVSEKEGGEEVGLLANQIECEDKPHLPDFFHPDRLAIMSLDQGGKDSTLDMDGRFMVRSIANILSALDGGKVVRCEEALFLLFALQCNAHRVVDINSGEIIGLGLYPLVSMLNHACDFNCEHTFLLKKGERPRLQIRAVKNIARGEECCYSYVPPDLPHEQKAELLKSGYGFDVDIH